VAQRAPSAGLAREAIGLREVLFQSITHMAPAAAVAFSIIVGANFAAGALPLSVLFALAGCLLVAVSIGQLAKQLPSAGGFYTYAARGLHPTVGFLVGWGYAFVDATVGYCAGSTGSCQAARIRSISGRTRARASPRGTPAISSSS
jgi:amino acid transporter